MLKDYYSIDEVSQMTGLTTRTIRNYLSSGLITASKVDRKWVFTSEEFEKMVQNSYVSVAIKIKNNTPVLDFLEDDKKDKNSTCIIIDRVGTDEDAIKLCEKICNLIEEGNLVDFRYHKDGDQIRIILTGLECHVKNIYLNI